MEQASRLHPRAQCGVLLNVYGSALTPASSGITERAGRDPRSRRHLLLRSDQEQYVANAERARDAEDDSFADLMVDVTLAEVDRDVSELREIDVALERLSEGTYGRCEMCAEDIGLARLQAQPTAVRCLACQAKFEQSHPRSTPTL